MRLKKRQLILLLVIVLIIVTIASCFGKKKLQPGTYEVTEAVFEVKDNDYELQVKNYGEYDVDNSLKVVEDASKAMTLVIAKDMTHTLYVADEDDIIQEVEQSKPSLKKKKKRR